MDGERDINVLLGTAIILYYISLGWNAYKNKTTSNQRKKEVNARKAHATQERTFG